MYKQQAKSSHNALLCRWIMHGAESSDSNHWNAPRAALLLGGPAAPFPPLGGWPLATPSPLVLPLAGTGYFCLCLVQTHRAPALAIAPSSPIPSPPSGPGPHPLPSRCQRALHATRTSTTVGQNRLRRRCIRGRPHLDHLFLLHYLYILDTTFMPTYRFVTLHSTTMSEYEYKALIKKNIDTVLGEVPEPKSLVTCCCMSPPKHPCMSCS